MSIGELPDVEELLGDGRDPKQKHLLPENFIKDFVAMGNLQIQASLQNPCAAMPWRWREEKGGSGRTKDRLGCRPDKIHFWSTYSLFYLCDIDLETRYV